MTTKPKQTPKDNGIAPEVPPEPESYTLELADYEVNLLHQVLANGTFQQVQAKQIAASVQAKIEALVSQEG
jgi:hypothetical protein